MRPLGEWTFPCPGIIGERHVFYAIEVDPGARAEPTEDGSALEHAAAILALPLADALSTAGQARSATPRPSSGCRRLAEQL